MNFKNDFNHASRMTRGEILLRIQQVDGAGSPDYLAGYLDKTGLAERIEADPVLRAACQLKAGIEANERALDALLDEVIGPDPDDDSERDAALVADHEGGLDTRDSALESDIPAW